MLRYFGSGTPSPTAIIGPMGGACQPRVNVKRILAAALTALAVPAVGRDYALDFGFGLPSQSGYLQTPAGGMPGTASPGRPTLSEIDLDGGRYRWLGAKVGIGPLAAKPNAAPFHLRFHACYRMVGDDATASVADAFTIRGGVFGAGDTVRSQVSFDSLTLTLTAGFDLPPTAPVVSVELGAEVGWTAFDFTMLGEHHRSERAYHVSTVGVVGAVGKDLGSGWHLGARLTAAPAFEGTGSRFTAEARLRRDLSKRIGVGIGAAVEEFRYRDAHKQAWPNRLQVTRRVAPTLFLAVDLD